MSEKNTYIHINPPVWIDSTRAALIVVGFIVLVLLNIYFGLTLFGIAIITLFFRKGFEIESKMKKYRFITFIFGLKLGYWKELPPLKYVSIVSVFVTKKRYSLSSLMIVEENKGDKEFWVNLIVDDKVRYIALMCTDKKSAFQTGIELGNYFDCKVLDSTKIEKEWIQNTTTDS